MVKNMEAVEPASCASADQHITSHSLARSVSAKLRLKPCAVSMARLDKCRLLQSNQHQRDKEQNNCSPRP
jgi:hypothetical protein